MGEWVGRGSGVVDNEQRKDAEPPPRESTSMNECGFMVGGNYVGRHIATSEAKVASWSTH